MDNRSIPQQGETAQDAFQDALAKWLSEDGRTAGAVINTWAEWGVGAASMQAAPPGYGASDEKGSDHEREGADTQGSSLAGVEQAGQEDGVDNELTSWIRDVATLPVGLW